MAALLNMSAQTFGILLITGLSGGAMEGSAGICALAATLAVALALALAIRPETRRQDAQRQGEAPHGSSKASDAQSCLAQPRRSPPTPAADRAPGASTTSNAQQSPFHRLADSERVALGGNSKPGSASENVHDSGD